MEAYLGHIAALTAALFWTLATLLYNQAGSFLSSAQLNLVKGLVATPLLLLALVLSQRTFAFDGTLALYLLLLSGVIGITIGDTLYFSALRRVGPWHAMLLEYLAPPFAAILAWSFLNERMSLVEVAAASIIIAGILLVLSERKPEQQQPIKLSGIFAGIVAAACQAIGLVLAFEALNDFEANPLEAAFLRIAAGTVALTLALILLRPKMLKQTRSALRHTSLPWLLCAIVMGTFLAIWLQQTAIAYISPGVAQTLLATAPLWLIPIQWLRGQPLSLRSISGGLVSLAGISLLFW